MLKALESGFDNRSVLGQIVRQEYNALQDPNRRKHIQDFLFSTGQIDQHGRVIGRHLKSERHVVIRVNQKTEERRRLEEMDVRYRVHKTRLEELKRRRNEDDILRMREQQQLQHSMTSQGGSLPSTSASYFKDNRVGDGGKGAEEATTRQP